MAQFDVLEGLGINTYLVKPFVYDISKYDKSIGL